jgi:hypothetical protein
MKAIVTEIPDPAQWPMWLEKRIIGIDLYDLVVGLQAIQKLRKDDKNAQNLDQICGSQLDQVYQEGLSCLSTDQLRCLFENPDRLLELQEQVLIHGGSYWDQVEPDEDTKKARAESLNQARLALEQKASSPGQVEVAARKKSFVQSNWHWLALAASVAFLIVSWSQFPTESGGGWGFDKSGLLTAQVDGKTYLEQLASAAGAFQKKVPDSREATLQRLTEFRVGCKKLIDAPNEQLTNPSDRKWLVDKCRDWLVKIEGHIADLEQGNKQWEDVLKEATQTADRMESVLREKSTEIVG